jgi:hypothetical protein
MEECCLLCNKAAFHISGFHFGTRQLAETKMALHAKKKTAPVTVLKVGQR